MFASKRMIASNLTKSEKKLQQGIENRKKEMNQLFAKAVYLMHSSLEYDKERRKLEQQKEEELKEVIAPLLREINGIRKSLSNVCYQEDD